MTEDELYRFQKLHEHADFLLEKLTEAKQKRMQTEEANVQLRAKLDKVERKLIAVPVEEIREVFATSFGGGEYATCTESIAWHKVRDWLEVQP